MTREQWILLVKKALRNGPARFRYQALHLEYILRETSNFEEFPHYNLRIELRGRVLSDKSYGSLPLERVLEEHPLDRFTSERSLDEYL